MDFPITNQAIMNSHSQELLQKIQYFHPNLIQDDVLTNLAQRITSLIKEKKITTLNQVEIFIKNSRFVPDNIKKIITVYNTNNYRLTPFEYFLTKTEFNEISKDALLNRIGISVRPLKSKKVILAVLFAEIDEKDSNNKINSIIKEFSGKIPNWDSISTDQSIDLLFQLINAFRVNFNFPQIDTQVEFIEGDELKDKNKFEEISISFQKDRDVLLSSLTHRSFIHLMFSSIKSIAAKVDDDNNSNILKIIFQAQRILEQENIIPSEKSINKEPEQNLNENQAKEEIQSNENEQIAEHPTNENLTKQSTAEEKDNEQDGQQSEIEISQPHSSTSQQQEIEIPEESPSQQPEKKEELIESETKSLPDDIHVEDNLSNTQKAEIGENPTNEDQIEHQENENDSLNYQPTTQEAEKSIEEPKPEINENLPTIQPDSEITQRQMPIEEQHDEQEQTNTEPNPEYKDIIPPSNPTTSEINQEIQPQEEPKCDEINEKPPSDQEQTEKDQSTSDQHYTTEIPQESYLEEQKQEIGKDESVDAETEQPNQTDEKESPSIEITIEEPENKKEFEEGDLSSIQNPQQPTEEENNEQEQTNTELTPENEGNLPQSQPEISDIKEETIEEPKLNDIDEESKLNDIEEESKLNDIEEESKLNDIDEEPKHDDVIEKTPLDQKQTEKEDTTTNIEESIENPSNIEADENETETHQPSSIEKETENKVEQQEPVINEPTTSEQETEDKHEQQETVVSEPTTLEQETEEKHEQQETELTQPTTDEQEKEDKHEQQEPVVSEPPTDEQKQKQETEIEDKHEQQETVASEPTTLEQETELTQPTTDEQETEEKHDQPEPVVSEPPTDKQKQEQETEDKHEQPETEPTTLEQETEEKHDQPEPVVSLPPTDEQKPETEDKHDHQETVASETTTLEQETEEKHDQPEPAVSEPPTIEQKQEQETENKPDQQETEPTQPTTDKQETENKPDQPEPVVTEPTNIEQKPETEEKHEQQEPVVSEPPTDEQKPEIEDKHDQQPEPVVSEPPTIEQEPENRDNLSNTQQHPPNIEHETENKEDNLPEEQPKTLDETAPISQQETSKDETDKATEKHITLNKTPVQTEMPRVPSDVLLIDSQGSILTTPKKTRSSRLNNINDEDDDGLTNTSPSGGISLRPPSNKTKEITNKKETNNENTNKEITTENEHKEITTEHDHKEITIENTNNDLDDLPKPIDIDSPCLDPTDLIKRTLIVYNTEYKITSTDEPIKEMCDKLQHFIDDHRNDFKKSVTAVTARSLFDEDITVYKKAFVFCGKTWNEIRSEIEKQSKRKQSKEQVIFAIGSTLQQQSSSPQTDSKFNLCFVTRSTGLSASSSTFSQTDLLLTPNPKETQSQTVGQGTPLKKIASESFKNMAQTPDPNKKQASNSVPSRYKESTEKLEFEIANIIKSIANKNNSLQVNPEISARIRQEILNGRGSDRENNEIKEMVANEIEYPWARFYFNMGYDELIKKVKTEYKNLFSRKIAFAKVLVVSVINEDFSTNTFSAAVITGQVKNINNNNNNNNNTENLPKETNDNNNKSTPVANLNLKDAKGSPSTSNASFNSSGTQSANQSGSATPRSGGKRRKPKVISDFDRSHLFLEAFNNYRQGLDRGLPMLEFSDTLIDPAKDLSRTNMQNFTVVGFKPFIDAANKNTKVENVEVCATFESKTNDYVSRAFDAMLKKYQSAIESDNDKIAIGYWNDKDQNVSVACFLFRLKKQ